MEIKNANVSNIIEMDRHRNMNEEDRKIKWEKTRRDLAAGGAGAGGVATSTSPSVDCDFREAVNRRFVSSLFFLIPSIFIFYFSSFSTCRRSFTFSPFQSPFFPLILLIFWFQFFFNFAPTGLYWVLLGFTWFYLVLLGFTGFC